jgi:hypothetical protein
MADTLFVVDDWTATPTAQRLVVWAKHDHRVRTTHTGTGKLAFLVPDALAAAAPSGYGPTVKTGAADVTITPGAGATNTMTFDKVTGIDPNDHTTEKKTTNAPADLTVTALTGADAGKSLATWTSNQRHTWFRLRMRTAATGTGPSAVPAGPWMHMDIPGYQRQVKVSTKAGVAMDFTIQAKVTEGHYVPIVSTITEAEEPEEPGN